MAKSLRRTRRRRTYLGSLFNGEAIVFGLTEGDPEIRIFEYLADKNLEPSDFDGLFTTSVKRTRCTALIRLHERLFIQGIRDRGYYLEPPGDNGATEIANMPYVEACSLFDATFRLAERQLYGQRKHRFRVGQKGDASGKVIPMQRR